MTTTTTVKRLFECSEAVQDLYTDCTLCATNEDQLIETFLALSAEDRINFINLLDFTVSEMKKVAVLMKQRINQ